jgi:hypothetical protein
MRIAIVALTGVLLALVLSYAVVRVTNTSSQTPVLQPLYNYGSR